MKKILTVTGIVAFLCGILFVWRLLGTKLFIAAVIAAGLYACYKKAESDGKDEELTDEPLDDLQKSLLKMHFEQNRGEIPEWAVRKILHGQRITYADLKKFKPEQLQKYFSYSLFYMSQARREAYLAFGVRNASDMMLYHKMREIFKSSTYQQEKVELSKKSQPTAEQLGSPVYSCDFGITGYVSTNVHQNEYDYEPQYLRDRTTKEEYMRYRLMREWGAEEYQNILYRRAHPSAEQIRQRNQMDRDIEQHSREFRRELREEAQLEELRRIRHDLERPF